MDFTFENAKINYEVIGKGEPLLFLHGWGGEINSFYRQIEHFKPSRKCVAIDFLGFGKSDDPVRPMTVFDYALSVIALLDNLGIKKVDVIAHSFGGRVAFKLMSIFPDRVRSAVLVAPAGLKTRKRLKVRLKIFFYKLKKYLLRRGIVKNADFLQRSGSDDYKNLSPTMKKTFILVTDENLKSDIKSIKTPVLLVVGRKDGEVLPKTVSKIKKLVANSDMATFFGGHFCFIDEYNRFNFAAERFFSEI